MLGVWPRAQADRVHVPLALKLSPQLCTLLDLTCLLAGRLICCHGQPWTQTCMRRSALCQLDIAFWDFWILLCLPA